MKLHKLVFYAHGWHLGLLGEPLIDESIEAWPYGPVVRSLYLEFSVFGAQPITRLATTNEREIQQRDSVRPIEEADGYAFGLLKGVWRLYGKYSAYQLSELTHRKNTPWSVVKKKHPREFSSVIPDDTIREHFKQRVQRVNARAQG